jgi:hypothetical protein
VVKDDDENKVLGEGGRVNGVDSRREETEVCELVVRGEPMCNGGWRIVSS